MNGLIRSDEELERGKMGKKLTCLVVALIPLLLLDPYSVGNCLPRYWCKMLVRGEVVVVKGGRLKKGFCHRPYDERNRTGLVGARYLHYGHRLP